MDRAILKISLNKDSKGFTAFFFITWGKNGGCKCNGMSAEYTMNFDSNHTCIFHYVSLISALSFPLLHFFHLLLLKKTCLVVLTVSSLCPVKQEASLPLFSSPHNRQMLKE